MHEASNKEEIEKLGFTFVDRSDRRLTGLRCLPELQEEPFFTPLEYKGYIFLFVFESEDERGKLLDYLNAALPFISRTQALDTEYVEKYGHDISNSCHTVTEQMVGELGRGEKVTVNVTDKSMLSVRELHSLIRLKINEHETMTIDPTQPIRGQHDPHDRETYKLRESVISPLILVGTDSFLQRKFAEMYHPERNPFGNASVASRLKNSFLGRALFTQ